MAELKQPGSPRVDTERQCGPEKALQSIRVSRDSFNNSTDILFVLKVRKLVVGNKKIVIMLDWQLLQVLNLLTVIHVISWLSHQNDRSHLLSTKIQMKHIHNKYFGAIINRILF